MKLGTLVNPDFQKTLGKLAAQDIPLKTAFKLRGIIKRLNEELTKYDEVRQEALQRLGNKDDEGKVKNDEHGNVEFSDENRKTFFEEVNSLLDSDVDIGAVSVNELGDKLSIKTADLLILDSLVTE